MSAERAALLRDAHERVSRGDLDGFLRLRQWVADAIRFREGRIAAITALFDRDDARRAAGLG